MRAKSFFTVIFALSLLVVAVVGVRYISQKGDATVPQQQILAASMPLSAGTLLRAQDVTWQTVSIIGQDQVLRPNAAALAATPELDDQTRAGVYGAVLRHALAVGDPIRRGDIVKPGDRDFLQVVLTPGARAIAIPVSTGGASTGLLSPGDFVDVILTQDFRDGNTPLTRRSVGETVADNLRVLAIDAPDAKGSFGRTVTLEVSAEQAEEINVAAELGKLSLTLRSVTDPTDPTRLAAAHVKPKWAGDVSPALYGAGQEKPVPVTPPPAVTVFHGMRGAEAVKPD